MLLRISKGSKSLSNVRVAVKLVDPLFRNLNAGGRLLDARFDAAE